MKAKEFYLMCNVGGVKYLVNYCKGESTNLDGSLFTDVACFSNKAKANQFVKNLVKEGYNSIQFGLTKFF